MTQIREWEDHPIPTVLSNYIFMLPFSMLSYIFMLFFILALYTWLFFSTRSGSSWLIVTPWTMRSIMNWVKDEYNNPPLLITENGMSDRNGSLEDDHRVYYYQYYINFMLQGKVKFLQSVLGQHIKLQLLTSFYTNNIQWSYTGISINLHADVAYKEHTKSQIPK